MIESIVINFIPILLAILIHEIAHGFVAYLLGDSTAKDSGRLSFNPIHHVDIWGTILVPVMLIISKAGIIFGWAKPVPVNYANLNHPRRDLFFVSAAGIFANLLLAVICAILLKAAPLISNVYAQWLVSLFLLKMIGFNIILAVFNALPIPPLDGSKILFGWMKNPLAQKYLSWDKQGMMFIIFIAFVVPIISQYYGYSFNLFSDYLLKSSKFLISLLV